jgi:hypothetical protein
MSKTKNLRTVSFRLLKVKIEKFIYLISLIISMTLVITSNLSAQRNNPPSKNSSPESDFKYEEIGDFSKSPFFVADIIPLRSMIYGKNINLGSGIGLSFHNIAKKVSIETEFVYNYYNFEYISSIDYYYGTKPAMGMQSMEFGGVLSYTFKSSEERFDSYTLLKSQGITNTYSNLPANHTTAFMFQTGFKNIGMYNVSESKFTVDFTDPTTDSTYYVSGNREVRSYFKNKALYIGIKRVVSSDTRFKTDKYGEVSSTNMSEIYGGLFFGLKSKFPTIYKYLREDSYQTNMITSLATLPSIGQQELESNYKYLPIGMRVGWMNSDRRSGLAFSWEIALYPGYYRSIFQQMSVRLGLNFRIVKNKK